MREELNTIERSRNPKERSLTQLKASLEGMQTTQEGLESELHQELLPQLSASDQKEVDTLNDDIRALTQENKSAFTKRMKLEAEKNKLENLLNNNLNRRKDELVLALQEISVEDRKQQLENSNAELKTVEANVEIVQGQLKGLDKKLKDNSIKLKAAQGELDKWKTKEKEVITKMESDARELEKMASKQTLYQDKISESTQKIRDLGSLPSEAFSKYQSLSTKQLFKQLEKANSELKKYSHVNKKALDQFVSFSEQKETLLARKEELDRAHESIQVNIHQKLS
jgi:structural maintenance of chromosome 3 (chondroitin sulfate proteoglycan 6)